jgi:hypothetical protein
MERARAFFAAWFLVAVLGLLGCGDSKTGEVSGKVTVDGVPIEEGAIAFSPMDGKSKTAGGKIKDGTYSVAVPTGAMKVTISKPKITGYKKLYPDDPKSEKYPVTEEALPPKYADSDKTELRLDVTGGKMQKDWELKTK